MASGYEKSDYSGPDPAHVIWGITFGTFLSMVVADLVGIQTATSVASAPCVSWH
jgi:hypothetical protein